MKKIILDLHKKKNACILNSQDIYKYVGELDEEDIELAYYINKYCEYLNYHIYNSREILFGDTYYARLEVWLDGYNLAKKYETKNSSGVIEIITKKYHIFLKKPFLI